jgi:hypothetical protein
MDEPDTPVDSPLRMRDVMESPRYLDLWRAKLAPGDPAFDFELPLLETADTVRLSSFRGERPVVLIFGSYT